MLQIKHLSREREIQKAFVRWMTLRHPEVPFSSFPNDFIVPAQRSRRYAIVNHMLALGMRPGMPDIVVFVPSGEWHGLFLEFKRPGQKPRHEQIETHDALARNGYLVVVVHSLDEAVNAVEDYLGGCYV